MDFTLTESQEAIAGLADQIFSGQATVDRVKEVERTEERFDRRLWDELAKSNLLGAWLPEEDGGSGLGMTELCLVLEQQGRRVAAIPLVWTAVAAMTLAEFGPAAQRAELLAAVIAGDAVLTLALSEGGAGDVYGSGVAAATTEHGFTLSGTKFSVPYAHVATRVLVPARLEGTDELVIAVVDPHADGVTARRADATNHEVLTHLTLDGVRVTADNLLADPSAARFAVERALTGLAAIQVGVAEEALAQAAAYTSGRVQFGKPLSTFQSASARAADAYIDTEAMRATLWQAAWRLDSGLDASLEVEVAKWWASEAGQRVVHATQHLHGGIGADIEYPIHRYFLWGKQIENMLGGGSAHLARIGRALAEAR